MLEKFKNSGKLGLTLLITFYTSIPTLILLRFFTDIKFSNNNYTSLVILDFFVSLLIAVSVLLIYKTEVYEDFKSIKEEFKDKWFLKFMDLVINWLVIFFIVKIFSSYVVNILNSLINVKTVPIKNQSTIETIANSAPILMMISAVIFAPISEELLYRLGLAKLIKNKKVFVFVSGLIFGLVHIAGSLTLVIELILLGVIIDFVLSTKLSKRDKIILSAVLIVLILEVFALIYYFQYGNLINAIKTISITELTGCVSYIIMGFCLAIMYAKHESIHLNIWIHGLNNLISTVIILFLK